MKYFFSFILLALFSFAANAEPYDQPYTIISVEFYKSADYKLKPVILNRIDDQSTTRREEAVSPGKHLVVADLPANRKKLEKLATQKTLEIDAKACTRYFFAAKLTDLATRHWDLVLKSSEPIGECEAKFPSGIATAITTAATK